MDGDRNTLDDAMLSPPLFVFPAEDSGGSSSSRSSSQHSESPRNDWTLPWVQETKLPALDDLSSLSNLSMDLSYPSDEHWKSIDMDTDMSAFLADQPLDPHVDYESMFQFTLAQPDAAPAPLQLPTPRAGSTSSRSASPVPQHDSTAGVNPSDLTLFTQLGQMARDAAGVILAVPADHPQAPISPVSPQVPPSKVPIPRLRPTSALAPLPKPTTAPVTHPTPPSSLPASSPPAVPPAPGKTVRPKTSHTTIERRYRTNLNARILALRRAVPALRILEKNTSSQTQGKGLTGATAPKWDFDDVINERGYVDGVRAAKKNSKGVVLGKAVEYIHALKRREGRLKREGDGLRTLISGLVGGPALLREWEREWRARFGGEEGDEVEEDEGDGDVDLDGDDGAGEEDSDEDEGRTKKRARTTKPAAPTVEKRKRGRPRKNPAAAGAAAAPSPLPTLPALQAAAPHASKPLLALALVFSLFRPSAPPMTHAGAVLTHTATPASGWSTLEVLHMLVSVLLLVSLVGAYLPRRLTRVIPDVFLFTPPSTTTSTKEDALLHDERALRAALGAEGGVWGVVRAALARVFRLRLRGDLRAWRRVGDLDVVRGPDVPLLSRVQTYLSLAAHKPRAPADSITLALLAWAFSPASAAAHWADARRAAAHGSAAEKLVLDMDVDVAAQTLRAATSSTPSSSASSASSDSDSDSPPSPVRLIAAHTVRARATSLAAETFVAAVADTAAPDTAAVHAAGRELGGSEAALTRLLTGLPGDVPPGAPEDAAALLRATLLFRRVFSGANSGVQGDDKGLRLALRRALANPVFDKSAEVEEARDRVVDMLAVKGGEVY